MRPRVPGRHLTLAVILLAASCLIEVPASAQDAGQSTALKDVPRGHLELTFEEKHPLGNVTEQCRRFEWTRGFVRRHDERGGRYDLEDVRFHAYVPRLTKPEATLGVLVHVSPSDSGGIPETWIPVLERFRIIAVGFEGGGNDREIWYRVAWALDALHGIQARYPVDPRRCYVTGFSGGARIASRLAFLYPDVFQGGIYQGGCNYFEALPTADGTKSWPKRFPKPSGEHWKLFRDRSRHAFVFGEDDFNREQGEAILRHLQDREGLTRLKWIQMPERGHEPATPHALAEAIAWLDAPLESK
ncbi:MAG: PHB depolymerase family esterase [Planctomycetota bacterium]